MEAAAKISQFTVVSFTRGFIAIVFQTLWFMLLKQLSKYRLDTVFEVSTCNRTTVETV